MKELKFFGRTVQIGKVENKDRKRTESKRLVKRIKETQLVRVREDIKDWRNAMSQAENVNTPDRTTLNRIFKDITIDAHLTSVMRTLILKTSSSPFFIENGQGEIDEDVTEMFRKKWFRDFTKYVTEAPLYGYSLIEFGDIIDNKWKDIELVKREYVIPEALSIKQHLRITKTNLIPFNQAPYDAWTIFVNDRDSLGLLAKAAPLIIWKKNVLGAWSEAAELFGMPIRMGKTDINNPTAYANMKDMLQSMGSAAFAVLDMEDTIDFAEISKSDYYQVYDKLVDRVNSEISKLILGQTMTSDDGSSRSQAQVHSELLEEYVSSARMDVSDVVNDKLIPLMARHGMIPADSIYRQDNEEKIPIAERFKMVIDLLKQSGITVPIDYIVETFGIPLEEVEVLALELNNSIDPKDPENLDDVENIMPTIKELMNKAKHSH